MTCPCTISGCQYGPQYLALTEHWWDSLGEQSEGWLDALVSVWARTYTGLNKSTQKSFPHLRRLWLSSKFGDKGQNWAFFSLSSSPTLPPLPCTHSHNAVPLREREVQHLTKFKLRLVTRMGLCSSSKQAEGSISVCMFVHSKAR